MSKKSVNEIYTDIFIKRIEKRRAMGETVVAPWRKPWSIQGADRNMITDKAYRGGNIFMTAIQGYSSPLWLTAKQAATLGGSIKKDENGKTVPYTPITYWNFPTPQQKSEGKKPFCRYSRLYNTEQTEGIEELVVTKLKTKNITPVDPIASAQAIVSGWKTGPGIEHRGDVAAYSPSIDRIRMPYMSSFNDAPSYYSTLFHEMSHSTGHSKRLARDGIINPISFGSHAYSQEELVAEMSASMLLGAAGIVCTETMENAEAYLDNWLKKLRKEPSFLVKAGGQAQKAHDHILGITWN